MKGQEAAPLWEALKAHVRTGYAGFHVPGHKGRYIPAELYAAWGPAVFAYDLTELQGLDNLHAPEGPIKEAQRLAAELYGARHTFFLVGGTSAGLIASLLAVTKPGDKVLLPRFAHRSLLAATILGDLRPLFYPAAVDPVCGLVCGWDQAEAARIIREHTDARALVLVHPTYHGLVGPAAELIQDAQKAGLTVIADEAHGPHFYFHSDFPAGALALGVDAAVQSTHKLLGSFTQSSWLHIGSERISPEPVAEALRWLESSSPSYLLMASLDLARRQAALTGARDWGRASKLAQELRQALAAVPNLEVWPNNDRFQVKEQDPCKITVYVGRLGVTGPQAAFYLQEKHRIQVELVGFNTLLLIITPADNEETIRRVVSAMKDLAAKYRATGTAPSAVPPLPAVPVRISPREAAFSQKSYLSLSEAVGKIAAQALVPYPPGVPAIWPGEEFTVEVAEVLNRYVRLGIPVQGLNADAGTEPHLLVVEE